MELPFKPIPLILTSSKLLASPPDSGLVKKRKLSECSDSSNTNSLSDRGSLNERFLELSLDNRSKLSNDDAFRFDEELPMHTISIPKPVRPNVVRQEEAIADVPLKNENFLENLIKLSQTDVSGISKYLNLDLGMKMSAWDKIASNSNESEKFKMGSVFKSFLNSPFGCPFLKPDLLMTTPNTSANSQGAESESGSKFSYRGNTIGILTQDQRQEKVNRYLEKKKNRHAVKIRYNIRKDLADKRERHQGRFVKTPKPLSHSDLLEKPKIMAEKHLSEEPVLKNNSDFVTNKLSRSSNTLGKRINKSDLFTDSSIDP